MSTTIPILLFFEIMFFCRLFCTARTWGACHDSLPGHTTSACRADVRTEHSAFSVLRAFSPRGVGLSLCANNKQGSNSPYSALSDPRSRASYPFGDVFLAVSQSKGRKWRILTTRVQSTANPPKNPRTSLHGLPPTQFWIIRVGITNNESKGLDNFISE